MESPSLADRIRIGNRRTIARVAAEPIIPVRNNLVSRPWGGTRLCTYKELAATPGRRWGEAFELAAFAEDEEAATYPSIVRLSDGSEIALPELLAAAAEEILGKELTNAHGARFPLLPKTLDVGELLSVQAHPEGFTEVYIIIEADEGATIRVGFKRDVDATELSGRLKRGRRLQQQLLDLLEDGTDTPDLQRKVAGNFAQRGAPVDTLFTGLAALLRRRPDRALLGLLQDLKALYWEVLDLLNEIPVKAGQIIHNANPEALSLATGRPRSAEVHALGNPEGKGVLALEIRRPGPTFRAWDHVRFPLRPLDIDKALGALNLESTGPSDFIVTPRPIAGRRGVFRSVEDDCFTVDHLRPRPGADVAVPAGTSAHALHAIRGRVALRPDDRAASTRLSRGGSALIPSAFGGYRLASADEDAEVVMVTIPVSAKATIITGPA